MSETLQFKTFCIEQYKYEHNMIGAATLNLFQKYGVLDYLTSFFDVLHTTGAKYIVQDIDEYISNRQ